MTTTTQLSALKFPFPPKTIQDDFADFVQQVDKLKVTIQKSLDEIKSFIMNPKTDDKIDNKTIK